MRNFDVRELVPESVYNDRGERSIQLIDKRITTFLDELRDFMDVSITCNDWKWGGRYQGRGLRTPASSDYSLYSMHTQGKAIDCKLSGLEARDVRQWIIDNKDLWWVKPITFIEAGESVTWLHVDVRNNGGDLWVWNLDTGHTDVYKRSE